MPEISVVQLASRKDPLQVFSLPRRGGNVEASDGAYRSSGWVSGEIRRLSSSAYMESHLTLTTASFAASYLSCGHGSMIPDSEKLGVGRSQPDDSTSSSGRVEALTLWAGMIEYRRSGTAEKGLACKIGLERGS
jgi:hypothetical protein